MTVPYSALEQLKAIVVAVANDPSIVVYWALQLFLLIKKIVKNHEERFTKHSTVETVQFLDNQDLVNGLKSCCYFNADIHYRFKV